MQEPSSQAGEVGGPNFAGFGPFGLLLVAVSRWFALAGGAMFVAIVIMSIVSIVGRKLFSAPVPGDVELLQLCAAIASATFFAYCHLTSGHVKVEFFTSWLAPGKRIFLDTAGSFLLGLFGALIAWRTFAGAISLREAGETSAILALPVWWALMAMVPSFALLGLAGFYVSAHTWSKRGQPS